MSVILISLTSLLYNLHMTHHIFVSTAGHRGIQVSLPSRLEKSVRSRLEEVDTTIETFTDKRTIFWQPDLTSTVSQHGLIVVPPSYPLLSADNLTNEEEGDDDEPIEDPTRTYVNADSKDDAFEVTMERRIWPADELSENCRPMAKWQSMQFPTCNELHSTGLAVDLDRFNLLSAGGYWRLAWKQDLSGNEKVVWKTFK